MTLRSFSTIIIDILKVLRKKISKDKFFLFKLLMYSAYIYIIGNKAMSCFRLLVQQLKKRTESVSFSILSLCYLIFVFV